MSFGCSKENWSSDDQDELVARVKSEFAEHGWACSVSDGLVSTGDFQIPLKEFADHFYAALRFVKRVKECFRPVVRGSRGGLPDEEFSEDGRHVTDMG